MASITIKKQQYQQNKTSAVDNNKGFTLIEMAIVLVIIGLLIGFSLKGVALIHNAQVKRVVKMADEYRVAVMTYFDRFDRFPGDDPDRRNRPHRGDGNGQINFAERFDVFNHLATAGIISGSFNGTTDLPRHPFGDDFMIFWQNPPGVAPTNHYIRFDNLPWDVAQMIDRKHDDGVWNTGAIVANEDYIEANSPVANFFMEL